MTSKNLFDYVPDEFDGKNGKVKLSDVKESPLIGVYFSTPLMSSL